MKQKQVLELKMIIFIHTSIPLSAVDMNVRETCEEIIIFKTSGSFILS